MFWSVWSLRFTGVENIGLWSILAAVGTGAVLLAIRKESWHDIGLHAGGDARFVTSRAAEFSILVLVTGFTVIGLATAIGYPPSQSAVLTQQPESLSGFLLDIVFGVWIGAAIGEELFFRGLLLTKFTTLFGGRHWRRCGHVFRNPRAPRPYSANDRARICRYRVAIDLLLSLTGRSTSTGR